MLGQRHRRWTNFNPILDQYIVFAGKRPALCLYPASTVLVLLLVQHRRYWLKIKSNMGLHPVFVGIFTVGPLSMTMNQHPVPA